MHKGVQMKKEKTVLEEASEIVVERLDQDHNDYGEFSESMGRAKLIYMGMTGRDIPITDMYAVLIALKLSRESFNHKRDNLVDICGYIQGLDDFYMGVKRHVPNNDPDE
tara:strand:+ start:73 stop:399 length:327 start_codon:yes stop_codon:yes gene_type:complete